MRAAVKIQRRRRRTRRTTSIFSCSVVDAGVYAAMSDRFVKPGSGAEMPSPSVAMPTPPRGMNPPPMDSSTPPSVCPKTPSDGKMETEPSFEDVQEPLYGALNACRHTVKKQICDDVERRLKLFEDMWKSGKLSHLVKHRMHRLSQDLKRKNWDAADEIHRGLMVDHVAEVSQWMVGVKRLIAEARSLNPEQNICTDPGS
uniref:Steroid receptor RNA activator 1 n=1 Tax=Cyprinus carpio TaxID=7962 RepID=A0A8C2IAS5_CYPCA